MKFEVWVDLQLMWHWRLLINDRVFAEGTGSFKTKASALAAIRKVKSVQRQLSVAEVVVSGS